MIRPIERCANSTWRRQAHLLTKMPSIRIDGPAMERSSTACARSKIMHPGCVPYGSSWKTGFPIYRGCPRRLQAKIRRVTHRELFEGFEDNLPTFNSLAIETLLWRIPDLAEQFLYFNDDVFLTAPIVLLRRFPQWRTGFARQVAQLQQS